jgi:hypothetical protein
MFPSKLQVLVTNTRAAGPCASSDSYPIDGTSRTGVPSRLQSKAYTMDKSGIIFVIVLASVIEVTGRTYFSSLNLRALKALCFC